VKREKFQFSNTETRVLLALVTFSVTTAVLAGGMIMWIFTSAWDNGGIKLVVVLPVLRNKEIRVRTGLTCKLNLPYFCRKKREEGLFLHLVSNLKSDLNYLFPFGSFNPQRKVNIRRRGLDYALA
jgi:hypothetical protein